MTQPVPVTTLQFNEADATSAKLRRLVQDLVTAEQALNSLISAANSTVTPDDNVPAHVLATVAGLGADHTTSGLTVGQVLRAISATNAAFSKLKFSDLANSNVSDTPSNAQYMQFVDGYWQASAAPPGGSTGLNIGAGAGIYASNSGAVLQFKTLLYTAGLLITAIGANSLNLALDPIPATAALLPFATTLQGLVPPPGAVNGFFLRDDGTWEAIVTLAIPPIGAGWETSDGVTALALPIGAFTRYMFGTYTIKKVVILTQGGPGSCVVNIWKANLGSHYPPVVADDITNGVSPQISAGTTYINTALTLWTLGILPDDVFLITLASVANFTAVQLSMEIG